MNALGIDMLSPLLLAAARWEAQALFWGVVFLLMVAAAQLTARAWVTPLAAALLLLIALPTAMQLSNPLLTAIMLGALGLMLLLPPTTNPRRIAGAVYLLVAAGFFVLPAASARAGEMAPHLVEWIVLGILAAVTLGSAVAMICARSAVYSAIWFALTLLGTGGLFLYQGALFLGVATVVVYAGAIVVTFLFVIMLAQPDGNAPYDRISWGWFARPAAALAGAFLLGAVVFALQSSLSGGVRAEVAAAIDKLNAREATRLPIDGSDVVKAGLDGGSTPTRIQLTLGSRAKGVQLSNAELERLASKIAAARDSGSASPITVEISAKGIKPRNDPRAKDHMAHIGGQLFSQHLVAVEVAGTLLLAALVGAVAMLSQGVQRRRQEQPAPTPATGNSPSPQPSPTGRGSNAHV